MIFKTGPLRLEEWTSDSRSEWTSYWCVLTANDKDSLVLNFYDRQGDDAPSHSLALLSCDVRSKYDLLTVTSTVRVSFLNAASVAEAEEWVRKIKGAADGGFWARLQKSVSSASPVVRLSPAERAQRHAAQLDHFNECFVRATDAALPAHLKRRLRPRRGRLLGGLHASDSPVHRTRGGRREARRERAIHRRRRG